MISRSAGRLMKWTILASFSSVGTSSIRAWRMMNTGRALGCWLLAFGRSRGGESGTSSRPLLANGQSPTAKSPESFARGLGQAPLDAGEDLWPVRFLHHSQGREDPQVVRPVSGVEQDDALLEDGLASLVHPVLFAAEG